MPEPWSKYKFSRLNPKQLDGRVDYISSREGWYIRTQENQDEGYRIPNEIQYIYLSGHGHEYENYFVSNVELYNENLICIPEYERTKQGVLPIYTEVAIEEQIGREFKPCDKPVSPIKILVIEKSKFQQKVLSARLNMYQVTTTDDISIDCRVYDLTFLGSAYCDHKIDHDCVIRYSSMKREGHSDEYLHAPLTEENLHQAIRDRLY